MKTFFYYRADWPSDQGPVDVLLAFNAGQSLNAQELKEIVDQEVQRFLRPDQLIILTRASTFVESAQRVEEVETKTTLLNRLGGQCHVELVSFDHFGILGSGRPLQSGPRKVRLSLPEITRRGVTSIFNEHQGFVEGSESYHFRNPSGKHTNRFMRLSNILVRQAEISFLALPLLPRVPGDTETAYIDTPALFSIVSALNDLRRSAPEVSYVGAENFRSYAGVDDFPFKERDRSVAIISASSSGSLAGKLISKGFAPERVINLLYLGKPQEDLEIVVDLAVDAKLNPEGHDPTRRTYEGKCALCDEGSMFIELRGDQFDISLPQPKPLVIKQKHSPVSLKTQMARLVGSGCFTTSAKALHWIDPERLLASGNYQERLDYFLRRFVPAGVKFCILADRHAAPWGDVAQRVSGQTFQFVSADKIEAEIKEESSPILVLAPVIGSGRRLLDISRELRTAAPLAPITYIVGFAKPTSREERATLKNSLVFSNREAQHAFETVEEMVLPLSRRENAWDAERRFLSEFAHTWSGKNRKFIDGRIDALNAVSTPLVDDLFVANAYAGKLELRPGFAFWEENYVPGKETQADVFTTISAILQNRRTAPPSEKEEALRSGWFRQSLIDPEVFGRFNDGIIQASFLRAAYPSELDYRSEPELSEALARLIRRMIEGSDLVRGEGAFEFLLALGCRRLRLQKQHLEMALPRASARTPLVQIMRKTVLASLAS